MRHRPEITDVGWSAAKAGVLVVVFLTLAAFTLVSHTFINARAGRIACIENRRAMQVALDHHREAFASNETVVMDSLRSSYSGPPKNFGRCPENHHRTYYYDPLRGEIMCPNPFHQSGL